MRPRLIIFLSLLPAAGGCYDQPYSNGFGSTTPPLVRPAQDNSTLGDAVVAVRVGELGPNFAACNAQGEVRERAASGPIPVRAAPYEQAGQQGQLPRGSSFFICSRSLDQRWMGIVYDSAGRANRGCGVSAPVSARRDYDGPCESGWVASAQVRLVSGVQEPPGQVSQKAVESK
jgi:hypothetical protein